MIIVKKFHYGWIVAAVCFIMVFFSLGLFNLTFGLYQVPVTQSTSLSRAQFSTVITFRMIVSAVICFFFGAINRRISLRKLASFGMFSLSLALIIMSKSSTPIMFYLGGILGGIGLGFSAGTAATAFINNWFISHRGLVLGIVLASSGVGGAIFSKVISSFITTYGWRSSYAFASVVMFSVAVIVVLFIREKPSDMGLAPIVSHDYVAPQKTNSDVPGITVSEALRSPVLYILMLTFFLIGFIDSPIYVAYPSRMSDMGIAIAISSTLVSAMQIFNASSKVMLGLINDKFGVFPALCICSICNLLGLVIMLTARTPFQFALFAVIFGISIPLENIMTSFVVSRVFGRKNANTFIGVAYAFVAFGAGISNPLMGKCYDTFGSYDNMLYCCLFISVLVSSTLIILVKRSKFE